MKRLILISVLLIAIFAAACGASGNDVDEAAPEPAAAAAAPAAMAATAPAAVAQAAMPAISAPAAAAPQAAAAPAAEARADRGDKPTGGVLTRLWTDPPTLDPHKTSDTYSAFIVGEVFSGLVTLNTDLRIAPDIAERWEISDDGTVYTFHILPDVKFHDGAPVTAQDFVYSFNRAADPALASPVAGTYLNDIVGVMDVLNGDATEISGIKAIDERTLEITIDAPKAYFLAKLTYPTAFVVDRRNVESAGATWTDSPNATGPFTLKEYRIGEHIILERSDNFYRESAYLDRVVFNLAGGQAMALYENDEIDITGVSIFDLERFKDPEEPLAQELKVAPPAFTVSYIGFNTDEPPFDDVHFRRALNLTIDKELIANEVLAGRTVPAYGILPPGFPGYSDALNILDYDEEAAKAEMAMSKYSDPATRPRIIVTVPGTGSDIGIDLQVILEMWEKTLGVQVEIQQVEWATYLHDLNRRKLQVFALAWQADYPDPQDFLDILFHSESETNHGGYANSDVDKLLEQARVEVDPSKRISLYNEAEQLIIDDAAWVPLWYTGERHLLLKPHIKDYRLVAMTVPKLRYVYIDYDN